MSQNESFFDKLDPKQSFTFGIVGGILVLCTIGFFVLLGMQFTGNMPMAAGGESNNNGSANAPTNNNGGNQPAQPSNNGDFSVNPVDEERDHIRGAEDAKVTIIEFSDMECPFCSRFHETMKQVMDNYGEEDVRWVYRHFPLDSLHPQATPLANASECAADQGKFWEYTDVAFEKQDAGFNSDTPANIAEDVGLNMSEFNDCFENREYSDKVQTDIQDAKSAGGRGTPHSIIIGPEGEKAQIKGAQPFNVVEQQIQQFLNK